MTRYYLGWSEYYLSWEIFAWDEHCEPDTEETGYSEHIGPFDTLEEVREAKERNNH